MREDFHRDYVEKFKEFQVEKFDVDAWGPIPIHQPEPLGIPAPHQIIHMAAWDALTGVNSVARGDL